MRTLHVIESLSYHKKSLSPTNQVIADFFINNRSIKKLSIKEVAQATNTSIASVNRFSKEIGFKGYKDFVAIYRYNLNEILKEKTMSSSTMIEKIHFEFMDYLFKHFDSLDLDYFVRLLKKTDKLFVFGFGKTDLIGQMLSLKANESQKQIIYSPYLEHFIHLIQNQASANDYIILFYQHKTYKNELSEIILTAKKQGTHILVVSLDAVIDEYNYANSINLFPHWENSSSRNSTTMFYPFLAFIDVLGLSVSEI